MSDRPYAQSTAYYWWAFALVGAFALTLIVLLLTGVLGPGVWWTAAAMVLLALSQVLSIRTVARRRREQAESIARARREQTDGAD
ncbi:MULTISPECIES: hypothetical protein [unclassified Microbacterium]|uniref:hypothetical protein n=1 Tax=unclassified Microbacterium TaxID=2609290 RepID=UPI003016F8F2